MLYGAIGFSYDNFSHTRQVHDRIGVHSANLGDNMQSLAVRHLYHQLGIPDDRVVRIDRDTLHSYDGPPVVLPMNAVFRGGCLPVSPKVTPLWIGFHADAATIRTRRDWLATQGLIGCRDPATAEALRAEGIAADVTGCLTLSLPRRNRAPDPEKGRVLLVFGKGPGSFPMGALRAMPDDLLHRAEFVVQRREMTGLPLTPAEMEANDRIAAQLLHRYHRTAALVVTPLHHAASPAIAAGIPVIIVREEPSPRFGSLSQLLPVHLAPDFDGIDWRPKAVDATTIRAAQLARFRALLSPWLTGPAVSP